MKVAKIILIGESKKLDILVTDVLGGVHSIERTGFINNSFSITETYSVRNPDFDIIKEDAFRYGAYVNENKAVRVARIELIKESYTQISRVICKNYFFFKSTIDSIRYTDDIKAKVV